MMKKIKSNIAEKADDIASKIVSQYGVTSIQYALIEQGSITLSGNKGVFDKSQSKSLDENDMLGIGSVSKMYVTAAAMSLSDKGKLEIDEPLTTYIPEFKMADERYKQITPRMLMNHSSGLYGTHFKGSMLFNDNGTYAHDTLLSALKCDRLKSTPGEMSEYCNDGFTLLEILVERISGMKFNAFLSKSFFEPLGITNTKTPLDDFNRDHLAKTYMPMYDGALPVETIAILGTGGLYSTAQDMCKFSEILIGKRPDILSKSSAIAMGAAEYKKGIWPKDDDENLFGYGLGWDNVNAMPFKQFGVKAVCKGGDSLQYHAFLISIPDYHISMAVISSGGLSIYNYIFAASILQELLKEKNIIKQIASIQKFHAPTKSALLPDNIQEHSGVYASNQGTIVKIAIDNGEFIMPALLNGMVPSQKYVFTDDGKFKSADGSITISFEKQKNGNVYLQTDIYITIPEVGQVVWKGYSYQKLKPISILTHDTILAAWKKRAGKKYYLADDTPTSQFYFIPSPFAPMEIVVDFEIGYAYGGCKIIDENNAVNTLTTRDVTDLHFYTEDNVEYLAARGFNFIGEDYIPTICGDKSSTCTIQTNGYTKWFKVGSDLENKLMTVKRPQDSAFVVYDENGVCVNFTTVSGNNTVKLPENGMIAFIGNAGDTFKIDIK